MSKPKAGAKKTKARAAERARQKAIKKQRNESGAKQFKALGLKPGKSKGRKTRAQAASRTSVIPQGATRESQPKHLSPGADGGVVNAASGPGKANESAPAPAPASETPQELKQKVEAVKRVTAEVEPIPASKEEVARLKKLGLREYPVKGTALMLVGLIEPGKEPTTVEQRVEMAKRLNEVGPKLPRYVMHLVDEKRPESSSKAIVEIAANVLSGEQHMAKQKAAEAKKQAAAEKKPAPAKKGGAATPAKKVDGKKKGGGIGGLVESLLIAKKSPEEILKEVKKQFPDAKTSNASIAWYRNKLRQEGRLPKA